MPKNASVLKGWTLLDILWAVFPTRRLASAKARAFADFVETIAGRGDVSHWYAPIRRMLDPSVIEP